MSCPVLTRFALTISLASTLFIWCGCSGGTASAPSDEQASAEVKTQVTHFIETARKSPKSADANAGLLLESLQARVEQYGDQFQPLVREAESLQALQEKKAPAAEIEAQLAKLQAAADQL